MIIRKDLVIAILATFCLTAVLFTAMPVSSSGKQYDPWLDYNDDGIIDLKDVYPMHQAYGTEGDPTKNVTVTNWPPWWPSSEVNITNWPLDEHGNLKISITGVGADSWRNSTFSYDIINLNPSCTYISVNTHVYIGGGAKVTTAQFDFQPISQPFNITDVWVTGILGVGDETVPASGFSRLKINDLTEEQSASGQYPTYFGIQIHNGAILQSIHLGTNTVSFVDFQQFFWKITIHITYAYLG